MVKEVIGFDIGHGQSTVARMALLPNAKPAPLEIDGEQCQITAIASIPGGKVVVGDQVFRDPRVTNLRLGFKQRPPGSVDANEALRQFVHEYHRLLLSTKQILGGEQSFYFVGCPSSWTPNEQGMYQRLLEQELPAVKVVPESRAALLQAREAGWISHEQVKGTILVIDIGSSTTDVSLILGGIQAKGIDFGRELGGHLIDKAILDYVVLSSPHREMIEQVFASRSDARVLCERSCRRAKEEYWKGNEASWEQGVRILVPLEPTDLILDFRLDGVLMDSILSSPRSELKGQSWIGCFVNLLKQVRDWLTKHRATPGVLVLTGGPSRMAFVQHLCEEYFPHPKTRVVRCVPPEETVALGLAQWGSIFFQTSAFIDEVESICSAAVPAVVKAQVLTIRKRLAEEVSAGIVTDIVKVLLEQWRAGVWTTLDSMQDQLKTKVEAWLASRAGRTAIQRSYKESLREICSEINSLTLEICTKYGIPHSSFRLDVDLKIGNESLVVAIGSPFDAVTGIAAGVSIGVLVVLTGIAKSALLTVSLTTGPPGWLVGALLAAWAAIFGTMKLEESLGGWNLPLAVRRTFLSNARCRTIVDDARSRLRESLMKSIGDSDLKKIEKAISHQVSTQLRTRADEVRWIIS